MIADSTALPAGVFTPDELVSEVTHLPSAPRVLPRLKRLLCDGNSSMFEIIALIRLDLGIAARVLQVANSPYYNNGLRCLTIDEAVQRVGYDRVYDLVGYAVASQVLVRPLAAYGIEADEMWRESVACALAAETLALYTGHDRSAAYTVGLMHGVGKVAIDEWAGTRGHGLRFPNAGYPLDSSEGERSILGFSNADVGAALLRHWDFPDEASEPVGAQYAPSRHDRYSKIACLLFAAKWIKRAVCTPERVLPPLPPEPYLQHIPLSAKLLRSLVPHVETRIARIDSLLDVEGEVKPDADRTLRARFPVEE